MKAFHEEQDVMTELSESTLEHVRAYMLDDPWRWIPSSLAAVLLDASGVFNDLFWIIILLWGLDLALGLLKVWHFRDEQVEWFRLFRSVVKLFVICVAVISMNAIEQMLQQMGLDVDGSLVLATMFVIGSADAFSIMSNLTVFYPGLGVIGDRVRDLMDSVSKGKEPKSKQPPPEQDE